MNLPNTDPTASDSSTTRQLASSPMPLSGKLALITGASRGIGAAIARNIASKGASIVLNYTSDSSASQCEALKQELESKYPTTCLPVQADIGHPSGPTSLVKVVNNHFNSSSSEPFQIDIIINNAGVASNATIEDFKVADFDWMYRINVLGPLLLMQAVLTYLPSDRSGRVVNLSSISSTEGFIGQSVYGGTKAALEAMTRTWARELAERCTVNAINPGPVKTDMWDRMPPEHRGGLKSWTSHSPLAVVREGVDDEDLVREANFVGGRPAYAHEIASIVAMLCSEDSAWCTGQVICANGGMRMAL
ncbi:related to 3-oxoacyl-[acyl-carrier-protein] reductase [Phialocephala subalpina]|uniref:Related to 3-oxoacyl-[acyl-carrier-protein] reductase n=1 Tax=Phialocephala subalpina TaxID=576137 RepID=A0A1L7XPQ4_9HELO|nr:related to 3-oxoacyl-[acyl-carrier-protein] reductase [Phialocephala subalpina]